MGNSDIGYIAASVFVLTGIAAAVALGLLIRNSIRMNQRKQNPYTGLPFRIIAYCFLAVAAAVGLIFIVLPILFSLS